MAFPVSSRKVVLVPTRSPAAAATTVLTSVLPADAITGYSSAIIALNVTAQSGTTPTLDIYIQQEIPVAGPSDVVGQQPSGTSVWDDLVHFTQVAATTGTWVARISPGSNKVGPQNDAALTAATATSGPIGTNWRVKEVVGGTTPAFTYTITAILLP